MSETIWRSRKPGELRLGTHCEPIPELGEGAALFYEQPDWTRDPRTGAQIRVLAVWQSDEDIQCPKCGSGLGHATMLAAEVDGDSGHEWVSTQCVIGCQQFVWRLVAKTK